MRLTPSQGFTGDPSNLDLQYFHSSLFVRATDSVFHDWDIPNIYSANADQSCWVSACVCGNPVHFLLSSNWLVDVVWSCLNLLRFKPGASQSCLDSGLHRVLRTNKQTDYRYKRSGKGKENKVKATLFFDLEANPLLTNKQNQGHTRLKVLINLSLLKGTLKKKSWVRKNCKGCSMSQSWERRITGMGGWASEESSLKTPSLRTSFTGHGDWFLIIWSSTFWKVCRWLTALYLYKLLIAK